MIRKAVHSFLVVSILATGLLAPLHAQIPYPSLSGAAPDQDANPSTSQPAVEVKQQRKEVADRLRVAQRQLEVQKENKNAPENAEATEKLSREVGNLKQLEVVLSQQQAAEERRAEAEKQERDLEAGLKELRAKGPSEPKPYSFLIRDQLRDELFAEAARKEAIQATVEATTEARSRAKTSLEEKERKRRKAKEALDTNKDENAKPHLVAALAEAELDSRLAGELVKLRDIEFVTEELAQKTYELRLTYLSEKSDWLAKDSTFTKADLEQQLFELEKRERDLKQSLQVAETTAQFLEKQWLESRGRLDAEADRPPALVEEVESRRVARLAQQQRITVLGQRLARLEDRRQAWNRRSKISRDEVSKEDRQKWYEETKLQLDQLNRERRLQAIRLDDVRKDQATLEARLEGDPQQIANMAPWLKSQQRTLRQLLSLRERNIISIDTSLRVHDKLLAELRVRARHDVEGSMGIYQRFDRPSLELRARLHRRPPDHGQEDRDGGSSAVCRISAFAIDKPAVRPSIPASAWRTFQCRFGVPVSALLHLVGAICRLCIEDRKRAPDCLHASGWCLGTGCRFWQSKRHQQLY